MNAELSVNPILVNLLGIRDLGEEKYAHEYCKRVACLDQNTACHIENRKR